MNRKSITLRGIGSRSELEDSEKEARECQNMSGREPQNAFSISSPISVFSPMLARFACPQHSTLTSASALCHVTTILVASDCKALMLDHAQCQTSAGMRTLWLRGTTSSMPQGRMKLGRRALYCPPAKQRNWRLANAVQTCSNL